MKISLNKITATLILSFSLSGYTFAGEQSKKEKTNELIGLSSGAVIGTVIAGPLGGIVASVFGVMIADDINSDNALAKTKQALNEKDQQLFVMQKNFEQAKERAMKQIASMDNALEQVVPQIESNIQFKTASYTLEEHYKSQLNLIADTLKKNPKLIVSLSGFADKRGDSDFNQALSEKRALAVKEHLMDKGVKQKQVITHHYGESSLVSAGVHYEDDFFDRRVMLKVSDEPSSMTAANQ